MSITKGEEDPVKEELRPEKSRPEKSMDTLSRLMVRAYCERSTKTSPDDRQQWEQDLRYVAALSPAELSDFHELADTNHVLIRALRVLHDAAVEWQEPRIQAWCERSLGAERGRIDHGIEVLHSICTAFESRGCSVAVIKSLDHWPDLGSDFDLYTLEEEKRVEQVMREEFRAHPVARSWGDRLANKWNYSVPGLPELVEIHVQFLGQTGEHAEMATRVITRRVPKVVEGHTFLVPAPEERIVISALQRVYRHFYYRLCDMIDMAVLCQTENVRFDQLRETADLAGIWPGVATFLALMQAYVNAYGGQVSLPADVLASASMRQNNVRFGNGFLRVSKITGAELYGSQLIAASRHLNLRALSRLPLLPPLAISALVAHRLTGNDKGIW